MRNRDILTYFPAIGAAFFWSFSFIWFKIAYIAYKPITVIIFRLVISVILLSIIASLLKQLKIPAKKDFKLFILLAFFEPFLYFLGESYGLTYVSPTVAAVIVGTIPLLSPIAVWFFYKEKISRMNFIGFFLSFMGVILVVYGGSSDLIISYKGVGLEFIAVIAAIGYSIILRKAILRYNTMTIIIWQNLIGIFLFLPLWLLIDYNTFITTPFHPKAFRAIILLAVFASTFAYLFFTQSIRKIGINRSNIFVNFIPVFVAVLSFFLLKEEMGVQKILGIAVVIAGLLLAQKKSKKSNGDEEIIEIHTIS